MIRKLTICQDHAWKRASSHDNRQLRRTQTNASKSRKAIAVARTTTKVWAAALRRVDIHDVRWHDLRHTWASWHVQRGARLQELQELGGWSSYDMVLRYAHLAADHLKGAACRIEGTIPAQPETKNGLRMIVSR